MTITSTLNAVRSATLMLGALAVVGLTTMPPAEAGPRFKGRQAIESIAKGARTIAGSRFTRRNPVGRAFSTGVRAWDRAGWEAGRYLSKRKHGSQGDPGRYPGLRR